MPGERVRTDSLKLKPLVIMVVVRVREVRMTVTNRSMLMDMAMGFTGRIEFCMLVLMMLIMSVTVLMLKVTVEMFMIMMLGKVEPESDTHQTSRCDKIKCQIFFQENDACHRADKRRKREIGARSGRTV